MKFSHISLPKHVFYRVFYSYFNVTNHIKLYEFRFSLVARTDNDRNLDTRRWIQITTWMEDPLKKEIMTTSVLHWKIYGWRTNTIRS